MGGLSAHGLNGNMGETVFDAEKNTLNLLVADDGCEVEPNST